MKLVKNRSGAYMLHAWGNTYTQDLNTKTCMYELRQIGTFSNIRHIIVCDTIAYSGYTQLI